MRRIIDRRGGPAASPLAAPLACCGHVRTVRRRRHAPHAARERAHVPRLVAHGARLRGARHRDRQGAAGGGGEAATGPTWCWGRSSRCSASPSRALAGGGRRRSIARCTGGEEALAPAWLVASLSVVLCVCGLMITVWSWRPERLTTPPRGPRRRRSRSTSTRPLGSPAFARDSGIIESVSITSSAPAAKPSIAPVERAAHRRPSTA